MAVKIRLKRIGKKRAPHYRIVVMDARTKRDGRAIEEIGKYNPKTEPSFIHVESDRAQYWLGVGAQPTEAVEAIFKASGDWQKFKGLEAPAPLRVKEPKRDKQEIFNEALAEAHGTVKTDAVTTKKAAAKKAEPKAEKKADAAKDDAPKDEAPKDEAPKDEAAKVEAKADEAPAAEAPADDAKA
ncbi:small subunit ribosomal protein S16 [Kribbella orskensis]|uniref:Small ribosomal subunit protein bS16 n=1 Tax=Kribbella orskensis TaxID=2512216 RepID=A0ABY2BFM2_9ACTN|nr:MULTISPECIES: 30S ribosomal protein S16 [Kribbella]TCN37613.1 small subunit ribosomal protein S16 [Kribbella sp. VKM Ac-2500]TCO18885.1 small subunit ribosomal protein S16 [Kribbella orskensis]